VDRSGPGGNRRARSHVGPGRPAMSPAAGPAGRGGTATRAATAARAGARGDRPGAAGWVAYLVVLGCVAADLAWFWVGGARAARGGTLALAGAMFLAAPARPGPPGRWAGLARSRERPTPAGTPAAPGTPAPA